MTETGRGRIEPMAPSRTSYALAVVAVFGCMLILMAIVSGRPAGMGLGITGAGVLGTSTARMVDRMSERSETLARRECMLQVTMAMIGLTMIAAAFRGV